MKLVEFARTPNSRRVRIFLAEKGISIPTEQVDLGELEHKKDEFAELNPLQRVPVLVMDDGFCLSESIAICRYFEETQPDPPLMGRDARDKAIVEMWQRRMELNFLYSVMHSFRHLHPHMAALEVPQVAEWGEANKPRVMQMLELIDAELADRPYIAGDSFTIADITALVATDFMKPAKLEVPASLENFARWREQVSSRPSAGA
jgi:glutathione S-transferase